MSGLALQPLSVTPTLFPVLPVLEDIAGRAPRSSATRTIVVAVQHLLSSTGSLLLQLPQLGIDPECIFVLGKPYSTHEETASGLEQSGVHVVRPKALWRPGQFHTWFRGEVARLWSTARAALRPGDHVLILDDGGYARLLAPAGVYRTHPTVAIEQTTSGARIAGPSEIPVILVSASAAKILLEPPLICDAIAARVPDAAAAEDVAVIGLGNIGSALLRKLRAEGRRAHTFDRAPVRNEAGQAEAVRHLSEVVRSSSVIYGCSGEELTIQRKWLGGGRPRTLVSCSSGDVEFRSLLRGCPSLRACDPLSNLRPRELDDAVVVLRGGFPVNFDGGADSVPADRIALTRGLLLGGVVQARAGGFPPGVNRVMLSPSLQRFTVRRWLETTGGGAAAEIRTHVPVFETPEDIAAQSAGMFVSNPVLDRHYADVPHAV